MSHEDIKGAFWISGKRTRQRGIRQDSISRELQLIQHSTCKEAKGIGLDPSAWAKTKHRFLLNVGFFMAGSFVFLLMYLWCSTVPSTRETLNMYWLYGKKWMYVMPKSMDFVLKGYRRILVRWVTLDFVFSKHAINR